MPLGHVSHYISLLHHINYHIENFTLILSHITGLSIQLNRYDNLIEPLNFDVHAVFSFDWRNEA